ncbi:hypothetical protein AB0F91_29375 [Amycolatopsis sp. NPDC023774]|uniref:hypothetical protein n=1 Tax=Amycolatopsis sp. NPDC023774 TaxID=3155015 RepID=UPI0033EF2C41
MILIEDVDVLVGKDPSGVLRALRDYAHVQGSCRLLVLAGTERVVERLRAEAPDLVSAVLQYRMRFTRPAHAAALLDVVAAERSSCCLRTCATGWCSWRTSPRALAASKR